MKNFNNRYLCKNIHRYFTDISDISVKSNYRYIRVYRYFDPWVQLNFIFRERNIVADCLAKNGLELSLGDYLSWSQSPPFAEEFTTRSGVYGRGH